MISRLDEAITGHRIETYDSVAIDEYRHFCYNRNGKPEAEPGWHDDCVLADSLCEIARIFALKMEPERQRRAQSLAHPAGPRPTKYGQAPLTEEERRRMVMQQRIRNSKVKSRR